MHTAIFGQCLGVTSKLPIFVLGDPSDQIFSGVLTTVDARAEPMYRQNLRVTTSLGLSLS